MKPEVSAARIIEALNLQRHPEGGWYRESFRDEAGGGRAASTAIFYQLDQGQASAWHRVRDAVEIWHYYAGGPLRLRMTPPGGDGREHVLGPDLFAGQSPQLVVPMGWWQAAEPQAGWTLAGCTVAPGFEFSAFELAPPGWSPERA
jgi:predicted cupin superfamily sugar epimerase